MASFSKLLRKSQNLLERIGKDSAGQTEFPPPKPWVVYCFSLLIYLIFLGYCLAPLIESNVAARVSAIHQQAVKTAEVNAEKEINEIKAQRTASNSSVPIQVRRRVNCVINPLVAAPVEVLVSDQQFTDSVPDNGMYVSHGPVQPYLRIDALVLYTGIWTVITLGIGFLARAEAAAQSLSQKVDVGKPEAPLTGEIRSAEQLLTDDVLHSRLRAAELYSTSTWMLVAGVAMAFIGVSIFYVASQNATASTFTITGEPNSAENALSGNKLLLFYALHGIRPVGILVFLEGIAWFLLRQYRNLIEDYKSFHRIYLKRANYLIALKTLLDTGAPQERLAVLVASLIGEDLSGRLKQGESTETNEAVKNIEPNLVIALMTSMSEIFKQQKREPNTTTG